MSDYPSDGWAYGPSPKKKKKGKAGKQYTSYRLPRLDEVVLLQPISTRADGQQKEENSRLATVDDQLERYNRWLAFTQASRPAKDVRSTAADIQLAVYELNVKRVERSPSVHGMLNVFPGSNRKHDDQG